MSKSKHQEVIEAYQSLIDKLARETEQWARALNCYRDESGVIQGYFTVGESKAKFAKPCWTKFAKDFIEGDETFDMQRVWSDVKDRMIAIGIPIAIQQLQGHYIGQSGDQASILVQTIHYCFTSLETQKRQIDSAQFSGELASIQPKLQKRLRPALKDTNILELRDGIQLLLGEAYGIPQQLVLPSKT